MSLANAMRFCNGLHPVFQICPHGTPSFRRSHHRSLVYPTYIGCVLPMRWAQEWGYSQDIEVLRRYAHETTLPQWSQELCEAVTRTKETIKALHEMSVPCACSYLSGRTCLWFCYKFVSFRACRFRWRAVECFYKQRLLIFFMQIFISPHLWGFKVLN